MIWVVAYLVSIVVVPTFFMAFWCQRSNFPEYTIKEASDVFGIALFCVFWPPVIGVLVIVATVEARKNYFVDTSREILRKHNVDGIGIHDRSGLMVIPESDLKFLLKNYRKNRIKLDSKIVELIRDELMHRNAERFLFK